MLQRVLKAILLGLAATGFGGALPGVALAAEAPGVCVGRDLRPLFAADPSLSQALAADVAAMPFAEGKFFKVSKPGLAPSWLYGTIHVGDPRVTDFAPALLAALDGARVVALEVAETERLDDPDTLRSVASHALAATVARPSERADALLPPQDVAVLAQALVAHGMPAVSVHTLRPSFMAMVLATPACASGGLKARPSVDVLIARRARERGLQPVGLESLADQFDAMAAVPTAAQAPFLRSLLASLPYQDDAFETMIRFYADGQTGAMLAWSCLGVVVPGVETPVPPGFFETMVDRRNRAMRDAALPLLAGGGAFIAVGAAHLPGVQGLANLIAQAGYTVERADGPAP